MHSQSQLWTGRSAGRVDDITVEMGESISLDIELYREDIQGSIAHAGMLRHIGILSDEEFSSIVDGLRRISGEIEAGQMKLDPALEDIHTHVESRLIEIAGDAGKKLHTARSRNDQIALDTHLFVRRSSREIGKLIYHLCDVLLRRAEENSDTILPGYTHMQVAQPVRLSHHLMSHFHAFCRDAERFLQAARRADILPLGSGALAGVNYATDREFLRKALGFSGIYENSMDAVSSRDHILDFLYACAVFAQHASRVGEEIILWNSVEFSFIELPDELTTGSSIMPQKKNPDLAELARGKTGRIYGNLFNLLTTLKSLPLAYNRDLQEDRLPLLDSARQTSMTVRALSAMIERMRFRSDRMKGSLEAGFAAATDLADALVLEKKVPFREAHHIAGALVRLCVEGGWVLSSVPAEVRKKASEFLADDEFYKKAVDLTRSADKKISSGGSAKSRQLEQLKNARADLEKRQAASWPGENAPA